MKRRNFLRSLSAFSLAPQVPLSLAATPSIAASGTATYNHYMLGHALSIIRTKGTLTISELAQISRLTPLQAKAIVGELAKKGIISGGVSASGVLHAIKPSWAQITTTPQSKIISQISSQKLKSTQFSQSGHDDEIEEDLAPTCEAEQEFECDATDATAHEPTNPDANRQFDLE